MTDYKKAFELADKEVQEEEIKKIKEIVKAHLQKIDEQQKIKSEADEKIRLLKKDLEDLKEGRLDRIEERHKLEPKAREIRIIEIRKIEKQYIPMQPWYSPWVITYSPVYTNPSLTYYNGTSGTLTVSGNTFANFTSGTYQLGNGHNVTLC